MSNHSPGPWKVVDTGLGKKVFDANGARATRQPENVHLIAAAPDLLAALQNLLATVPDETREFCDGNILEAEAAIAKALGK